MNTQTQVVEHATDEALPGPHEIEVRRRGAISGAVGVAGCLVAVAWFARAAAGGALVDWVVCAVTAALGVAHLLSLLDARTPLLVADEHGVRVRHGKQWQGVTWRQVSRVEHHPRRGVLRDGSLQLVQQSAPGAEEEPAPLRLPLTLTTRVLGTDDLTASLEALAAGESDVVEVLPPEPQPEPQPVVEAELEDDPEDGLETAEDAVDAEDQAEDEAEPRRRRWSLWRARGRDETGEDAEQADERADEAHDEPRPEHSPPAPAPAAAGSTPLPLREVRESTRADVVLGATALRLDPSERDGDADDRSAGRGERGPRLPESRELRRDGSVDLVEETSLWGSRVRPIATPGEAVTPLVIEDHSAPAVDPVIGPELTAARTRLGLSVDQLAERTRIRPHVIESIEVDDFAPCGGDFYARGHLRTLARVLGIEAGPMLSTYDAQYADAPIDPRRVFEAELATGHGGSIRGTRGGPNWSVLVAAVMTVVLVWSVARLVMDNPSDPAPSPRLNSSGGVDNGVSNPQGAAVPVELTAAGGGSQVIVRSGSAVVFDDQMAFMQTVQLDVAPPIRVSSSDGGLLVTVDGVEEGPLGETGQEAQDIFVP